MKSLLLTVLARGLFWILCFIALYLLLRGHNAPGGGFIGGLVAATAFVLAAKGMNQQYARKLLYVKPLTLVAIGFLCMLSSGTFAVLYDQPYMSGQWGEISGISISSILLFDLGVFFSVLGGTLTFLFSLEKEEF